MRQILFVLIILLSITNSNGQKSTVNVGFLLDNTNSEINFLLDELEKEIIAVVGEDAIISFSKSDRLVNNFNENTAQDNYNNYINSDIDIIIAFGIVNNAILYRRQQYPKPTIIFGSLSAELLEGITLKTNVKNYIPIITTQSYREDLQYLVQLAKPKRVGVVLEEGYLQNSPVDSILGV